jgi:hypothetical protein
MEEVIAVLVWRVTLWLLRLLWLPLLVIAFGVFVVVPALTIASQLILSPGGLIIATLLLAWLARPVRRRGRR